MFFLTPDRKKTFILCIVWVARYAMHACMQVEYADVERNIEVRELSSCAFDTFSAVDWCRGFVALGVLMTPTVRQHLSYLHLNESGLGPRGELSLTPSRYSGRDARPSLGTYKG